MAAVHRANSTEQVNRFLNKLWQHQQRNEFCDFTLTTNNSSIECHKLVLSSASSFFTQLFRVPEQNINIIDVTPLPLNILKTVVAFMYNSDYVIDDENVIELLKFSRTWDLDVLVRLCVAYMNDNVSFNNACNFYNFALYNTDQNKALLLNEFIRGHFQALHDSKQLLQLSLKNFTTIIEHDDIDVENEDAIFSTAVQIIDQQACVEDIDRCLASIRFPHTSADFLLDVVQDHPLMKEPTRNRYVREALRYHVTGRSTQEVKQRRQWQREVYYIGTDLCLYQYVSKADNDECIQVMNIPNGMNHSSVVALHRKRLVIMGATGYGQIQMLLDMTDKTNVVMLPGLIVHSSGVILTDDVVFVFGGRIGGGMEISNRTVNTVHYLSLADDTWQTMLPMPHAVYCPLVVQHQQHIYVMGGNNNRGRQQQSVSQYSMEADTWKRCSDMPIACNSDYAGVVVHGGTIKVITRDRFLLYADDTDTWSVQQYHVLGRNVNAFIKRGQIWAAVCNNGKFNIMSYDDENNVWKTEKKIIKKAWCTRYFF